MPRPRKKIPLHVLIPKDMKAELKKISKLKDRPVGDLVRAALAYYLTAEEEKTDGTKETANDQSRNG